MSDIHREVIKLLVQIAWADREIAPEERDHILGVAFGAQLHEDEIEELRAALEDPGQLQAPDMGLLKKYRQEVMRAATVLIRADRNIADDEAEMILQIENMLAD